MFAAGLFFIAGEEISWGQRIFEVASPEYFLSTNKQLETNLHNLDFVQPSIHELYVVVAGYGTFAGFLAAPIRQKLSPDQAKLIPFFVPQKFLSSYFVFAFAYYSAREFFSLSKLTRFNIESIDQELVELLLSAGFLAFTLSNFLRARARPPVALNSL